MKAGTRRRVIWIAIGLVVLGLVVYGFWPRPLDVQAAEVERGELRVVIEEEGSTRARAEYVVSAPVAGYLRRVELEVGDEVEAGQILAELEAPRSSDLDPRSREEAQSRVQAAQAAVRQAAAQERAATAAAEQAAAERDRQVSLAEDGAATEQAAEQARTEAERAAAALRAARATTASARAELAAARAALQPTPGERPVRRSIAAPSPGTVLTVHRRSEGPVSPGEPLLEIGRVDPLEVRVNMLSEDAVRVRPGLPVMLVEWGRDEALEGRVKQVEPQAFAEVSALGVEERRVEVIVEIVSPRGSYQSLGSGYRVLARFVLWEDDDVLQVPTGALFREGADWAVFVIEDGRARERLVQIGQRSGLAAQVISGLTEGETVVVHPGDRVEGGARVRPRE
ncbi:MAG: efflux RND transporter periplasmic adaptor subunit [Myxococcota bacterium]